MFNTYGVKPIHQLIHAARKKEPSVPMAVDPPSAEDLEIPHYMDYMNDPRTISTKVLKMYKDKPRRVKWRWRKSEDDEDDDEAQGKGKGKAVAGSSEGEGGTVAEGKKKASRLEPMVSGVVKRRYSLPRTEPDMTPRQPSKYWPPKDSYSRPPRKMKPRNEFAAFDPVITDDQRRRSARFSLKYDPQLELSLDFEPRLGVIQEGKPLRVPREQPGGAPESSTATARYNPQDPLATWYFPRKRPQYWEMLDDVVKMFDDLHLQNVTLKHFQRPVDYVTVLLCLSNVVFAEMFETVQAKVSDGTYRIEYTVTGRTGVNLYVSAYSREHIYIAKSFLNKVQMQVIAAKRIAHKVVMPYMELVEPVERILVGDRLKTWGRVPDGTFSTYTDMESPTIIHEVAIAESKRELYWRCKRYVSDVPSVNLVVAIKVDSSECEWADLLVLARDPADNAICRVFNWVRFWGDGATSGDLLYYPSDFLEVEDRWKIPLSYTRPLDIYAEPR